MTTTEKPKLVTVLGHTFNPMTDREWEGLAGAEPCTLICYCDDGKTTLLLSPDGTVSELVLADNVNGMSQFDWTKVQII